MLIVIFQKDQYVPLKNIPSVNEKLKVVKHLLEITPLTFPNGLPEESDFEYCYIKSNGELVFNRRYTPDEEKSTEDFSKVGRFPLTQETFQKRLDKELIDKRVHMEYHPPHYEYKHNQDGKEYRYTKFPFESKEIKEA